MPKQKPKLFRLRSHSLEELRLLSNMSKKEFNWLAALAEKAKREIAAENAAKAAARAK